MLELKMKNKDKRCEVTRNKRGSNNTLHEREN